MKYFVLALLLLGTISVQAQSELPGLNSLDSGWNTIATDGVCSTGTAYQFFAKPSADNSNLLIFFNGGGGCWFGEACDLNSQPNIHSPFAEMDQNNPANSRGIFNFESSANPFSDYAMVFLPYCTGDVHIGGGTRVYSYTNTAGTEVSVTTYHEGYANTQTILEWVFEEFTTPNKVVLSGSSAGAIGSSFYSGLVAEHYTSVPVVLIADAAGGYGSPFLPNTLNAWNTATVLPDWEEYDGETNDSITFEDFYIASANHNPNLTIAQYNAAEDAVQITFTQIMGDAPSSFSLPQRLLNNYLEIESAVDEFYSYTAGGTVHMIMQAPHFYEYQVEGIRFVDWVADLLRGQEVSDVSCVNEALGCDVAPQTNID